MVILVGGSLAVGWRRGNGWGRVRFTPRGYRDTDAIRTKFYAWDDIDDVLDQPEKKRTRKAVVLALHDGSEAIIEGADLYVPRGVSLYWMVRHYWRHPEDRAELTDGRAVHRLKSGRLETS